MAEALQIEWSECLVPPRNDPEIEREFRRSFGVSHPTTPYIANSPWLARFMAYANYRAGQLVHLGCELADLIFLAVSQDSSCRFCYAAQRSALRIQGFDESRIRSVESSAANPDPLEAAAFEFARRFSRANPPARAADLQALVDQGFSEGAAREIAYVASYTVVGNRITTLPAIPTGAIEALPDRLPIRLFRPLVARMLRSRNRPGSPEPLPEALRDVPYGHVPRALDGLPCAQVVARFHDDGFRSGPLGRDTKDLVFAVVARGVGSRRCEQEARTRLLGNGLAERTVDDALAHLSTPDLDPTTNAILPFVRETIRPRPIDIQRRGRQLREILDPESFMDLVGVIGMANAGCRLSILLCES